MNEQFKHAFISKNRPKSAEAEQNDKIKGTQKNSKVVIRDIPDRGHETVIVVKIWGVRGIVKVVGLKGLAESKDRPSTTYTQYNIRLRKYIPHFGGIDCKREVFNILMQKRDTF